MSRYKLHEYNNLAYEFAIRNQKVIELLSQKLTDEVVSELLIYGIDATSFYIDKDSDLVKINSLQELYLEYPHLNHLNHLAYDPRNGNNDELNKLFKGNKLLVNPLAGKPFVYKESIEDALNRISSLIETRGKKLARLMNGTAFKNFDKHIFEQCTIYSMDTSGYTAKTIKSDIKYISEMIHPENYLQLLPKIQLLY